MPSQTPPNGGPLRIVHVITGLHRGGAETMLSKLVSRMDPQRFQTSVVSLTGSGTVGEQIAGMGVPVTALGMTPGVPSLSGLLRLTALLRREHPRIVQTWLPHADLIGLVAARLSGVPAVVWNVRYGELDPRDHPASLRWAMSLLARWSGTPAAIVVNSKAGRAATERMGYRPREWVLIPNGFDLNQFAPSADMRRLVREELGVPPAAPLIGLIARRHPMKDHATFFRAAARLHAECPEVRFLLAGYGTAPTEPELVSAIEAAGIGRVTHTLGERSDVPRLTAALDIACCTSYSEGFPNALGEAMASGVPCVTTDVGEAADLVGETGIVIPARDPAALSDAWRSLLALGAEGRRALGLAARERIAGRFDIRGVARQYEALYQRLAQATE